MRAKTKDTVILAGVHGMQIEAGVEVQATPAKNIPKRKDKVEQFFIRPLNGKWSDGMDRNEDDSILVGVDELIVLPPGRSRRSGPGYSFHKAEDMLCVEKTGISEEAFGWFYEGCHNVLNAFDAPDCFPSTRQDLMEVACDQLWSLGAGGMGETAQWQAYYVHVLNPWITKHMWKPVWKKITKIVFPADTYAQ